MTEQELYAATAALLPHVVVVGPTGKDSLECWEWLAKHTGYKDYCNDISELTQK